MATFFTGDQHFGHANILKHCSRPFPDVETMDEELIRRWNDRVGPDDVVWNIGDFGYRIHPKRLSTIFHRLNGKEKHLIIGNHDKGSTLTLPWSSAPTPYAEIEVEVNGEQQGRKSAHLVLFHYGMRVWPNMRRSAIHLYGHSHGRLPGIGRSTDVGVDCWDYRPVTIEEILTRIDAQPTFEESLCPKCLGENIQKESSDECPNQIKICD